ncbi:MAG TPA: alpha/beta fold hydrolase, partial [Longimicrobiales bacterium]|nr:alpha/beta fold hydrolase [Longimicrobiales bacterium]
MDSLGARPSPAGLLGVLLAAVALSACRTAPPNSLEGLLAVNGTELFVKRVGSGSPVLVIHGGPVMEHGYLLPWLEPLARERELIFFDQRLSGRSAGVVDSASVRLDTLVADMEGIRQALGLERWDLLAHSWGGLLAQRYAVLHPERVASMVLVSPMAPSAALWQAEEAALAGRITPEHQLEAARLREAPGLGEGDTAAIAALLRHSFRLQFHDPARAADLALFVPPDYL